MAAGNDRNLGGNEESFDTIIVGGGQAGLAAGYYLAKQGANFTILDQNARTGDSWRCRWQSLHLFTPSQFNNLPGLRLSSPKNYFASKDEIAAYLEEYARHFNLPIRYNVQVERLSRDGQGYHLVSNTTRFTARNVIVATGPYQVPFIPSFNPGLDDQIFQLHTANYQDPGQVLVDSVLVVGAGNSGAEIALELARAGKQVWLAGRDVGRIPTSSPLGKAMDGRLMWWMMTHLMTVDTPIGRKMQASVEHHGAPLGRATREEVRAAGVTLTGRMAGVQAGRPRLEDGQTLPVDGVIWATGFKPDFRWMDLPVFDEKGFPLHTHGVADGTPGLYFLGLPFQTGLTSALLGGVGKDAAYIAGQVSHRGH